MNYPFLILWIILIVLLILFVALNFLSIYKYNEKNKIVRKDIETPCVVSFDLLPNIANTKCCFINGQVTADKYVESLDMVVSTNPEFYLDVCEEFCIEGYDKVNNKCVGNKGNNSFISCVQKTKPVNCTSIAMPVAYSGTTYYYAKSATDAACKDQRSCTV